MTDFRVDAAMMRASDADRELAVTDLYDACRTGRLTPTEYEGRIEAALSSSTLGQLWCLTNDIPRRPQFGPTLYPTVSLASAGPMSRHYPVNPWLSGWYPQLAPREPNSLAVAGFVCSLVGFVTSYFILPSIIAGIMALVALRQIDGAQHAVGGRKLAVAALAISSVSVLIGLTVALAPVL